MKRWHGLKALVADVVEHGSRAVERVHLEIARKPFEILEAMPGVSTPAKVVHFVHDATVATTHVAIRSVSTVVFATVGLALDAAALGSTTKGATKSEAPLAHSDGEPSEKSDLPAQ